MTNRSNHIPIFTTMESTHEIGMLVRIFLNQKSCGEITLQVIIVQYAHQYGPAIRLANAAMSYSDPEYQAINSSVRYAIPTIEPVTRMILFINSMWNIVI